MLHVAKILLFSDCSSFDSKSFDVRQTIVRRPTNNRSAFDKRKRFKLNHSKIQLESSCDYNEIELRSQ